MPLARERGLELVGSSLDTHDWRGDPAQRVLAAVAPQLRPGAIVLAHDGVGSGARRNDARATATLVGPLVLASRARGLEPGPCKEDWAVAHPAQTSDLDVQRTGGPAA